MTRITVWRWLTRSVPDGKILPPWLTACQVALFPRRTLLWLLNRNCGFDIMTACWTIHGVRFSDSLFMAIAEPRPGVVYRFERKPGSSLVTVHEMRSPAAEVQPRAATASPSAPCATTSRFSCSANKLRTSAGEVE